MGRGVQHARPDLMSDLKSGILEGVGLSDLIYALSLDHDVPAVIVKTNYQRETLLAQYSLDQETCQEPEFPAPKNRSTQKQT